VTEILQISTSHSNLTSSEPKNDAKLAQNIQTPATVNSAMAHPQIELPSIIVPKPISLAPQAPSLQAKPAISPRAFGKTKEDEDKEMESRLQSYCIFFLKIMIFLDSGQQNIFQTTGTPMMQMNNQNSWSIFDQSQQLSRPPSAFTPLNLEDHRHVSNSLNNFMQMQKIPSISDPDFLLAPRNPESQDFLTKIPERVDSENFTGKPDSDLKQEEKK